MTFRGHAIAQAVRRWLLIVEARVRSKGSPCEICCSQSGTGTSLSPIPSVFPCQYHSSGAHILLCIMWTDIGPNSGPGTQTRSHKNINVSNNRFFLRLCVKRKRCEVPTLLDTAHRATYSLWTLVTKYNSANVHLPSCTGCFLLLDTFKICISSLSSTAIL
jgi:hypothetical protein